MATRTIPSLDDLRGSLLDELATHEANVAELRATVLALTGQSDSDSLLEREMAERAEARGAEAIADIRRALARMDDGTYGVCEGCGGPIPVARLEAIPFARQCVACPQGATTLLG